MGNKKHQQLIQEIKNLIGSTETPAQAVMRIIYGQHYQSARITDCLKNVAILDLDNLHLILKESEYENEAVTQPIVFPPRQGSYIEEDNTRTICIVYDPTRKCRQWKGGIGVLSYIWSYGDGKKDTTGSQDCSHVYLYNAAVSYPVTYTVSVTATDGLWNYETATVQVTVSNP
jgi:hypothetical protein